MQVKAPQDNTLLRLAQGAAVAALTIALMFTLSYWVGTCVTVPAWRERDYGFTFHCENGASTSVLLCGSNFCSMAAWG